MTSSPSVRPFAVVAIAGLVVAVSVRSVRPNPQYPSPPAPVEMTAEQDHQRMMDLLRITSIRRGPSGDPKAPDAANFDESKVATYTLPDPLVLKNSTRVTSAEMWWQKRRPEIVEDFDREIYGRVPKNTPAVNAGQRHGACAGSNTKGMFLSAVGAGPGAVVGLHACRHDDRVAPRT